VIACAKLCGMERTAIVCLAAVFLLACTDSEHASTASDASTLPAASPTISAPSALGTTTPSTDEAPSTSPVAQTADSTTTSPVPWVGPCGRRAAPLSYDHVIWIWMENKNTKAVLDSSAAPFIHALTQSCGTAAQYVDHGIHPSLPNYLAATSGGTQGVSDDDGPKAHPLKVDNIFRQVRELGKRARSYQENMPANCALQSTSHYAVKHNPAAYYVGEDDRSACERDDVAFDQFLPDLHTGLPEFAFITPDICNDMHDCSVATGDGWLGDVVSAITASPTYREGRTAVFIVFDESQGGGTMPFVAIAPSIVPGTRVETELDHYSLLAFTEDALGVSTHLGGAADAPSLADAFGI
jgi:hypothetical protein